MFAPEQPSDFLNLEDSQLFARLTPRTVKVIQLSQKETRRLKHSFVGTEQLLLALIEEGDGIAAQALTLTGVQLKTTRIEVEKIIGCGDGNISVGILFTPRAKLVIACGVESASELGHDYIDTENLLLGLLRANKRDHLTEGEGVAIHVLKLYFNYRRQFKKRSPSELRSDCSSIPMNPRLPFTVQKMK